VAAPGLAEVQQLLWKLITAPEGAVGALRALQPAERRRAEALIRTHGELSAVARLDIYANMYFFRIRDSLREDFPALRAVIGDERFHNLITDYLLRHPSSHFSLRYAGQHLPAFVAEHGLLQRWPYAADLCRLEWAILDAFDAAGASAVSAASLTAVPQDHWPELRFCLVPSARLLTLSWPVDEIWKQCQSGEGPVEPQSKPVHLRVWRQGLQVFHRRIDGAEVAALQAVASGASFAAVCECIATQGGDITNAERALELLGSWLSDELLMWDG
jgi:hypothetical protein